MNQPTTHTPGPWTFFRESSCDRGDSYGVKAPAPHHWVVPTLNIRPADARLIAAAPELLSALKQMVHAFLDVDGCHGQIETDAMDSARAAIARAIGAAE